MRKKAKILLLPLQRRQLYDYVGKILYRTGGPVKILSVGITIDFVYYNAEDTVVKLDKGEGFYKPVAYIVNPGWNANPIVSLRVSEHLLVEKYLSRDGERFITTLDNQRSTKVFITNGIAHKHNPYKPHLSICSTPIEQLPECEGG